MEGLEHSLNQKDMQRRIKICWNYKTVVLTVINLLGFHTKRNQMNSNIQIYNKWKRKWIIKSLKIEERKAISKDSNEREKQRNSNHYAVIREREGRFGIERRCRSLSWHRWCGREYDGDDGEHGKLLHDVNLCHLSFTGIDFCDWLIIVKIECGKQRDEVIDL